MNDKIPKIIHQIWLGPNEPPQWCIDSWKINYIHQKLLPYFLFSPKSGRYQTNPINAPYRVLLIGCEVIAQLPELQPIK